jgi:general secretion pathway protein E
MVKDPDPIIAVRSIAPALIAQARVEANRTGRPLLTALEERSGLTGEPFARALAGAFGIAHLSMQDLRAAQPRFDLIPFSECMQRRCLSLTTGAADLVFVLADPFDESLQAWALHRLRRSFEVALVHADDLTAALAGFEESLRAMQSLEGDEGARGTEQNIALDLSLVSIAEDESTVVRIVNSTLYDALKLNASDVHLETDGPSLRVKYRVDGVLIEVAQFSGAALSEQIISRVKVLADLDIAERRVPQDGRFKARLKGADVDFRVSVMPSIFGEDAVLRLLDRRALAQADELRLENLGLNRDAMAAIRALAGRPHGMLLVTGPTGSGKTTTLYAAISEINTGRDKIVTIEDPVEYRLPRVLQIPVNEKKGLTFARGLRSILRHDPDRILVGEIRDPETAQIAVQAALTGHLVFTTVHANSVFDVLGRFTHMGVDPYSLASALNGIVAQRLLRRNCPQCSRPAAPSPDELSAAHLSVDAVSGWNFVGGQGCGHCRGTGFKGRQAVAEVLLLDDALRNLIATKAPVMQLKEEARARGMVPIRQLALGLVARGETTLSEVERVAD